MSTLVPWRVCAKQVLQQNGINFGFASALRQLLKKEDRSDWTFRWLVPRIAESLFCPVLWSVNINPATRKYAWTGLDEYEVAYLNDFRWSPPEWLVVVIGRTDSSSSKAKEYVRHWFVYSKRKHYPIFATSKEPIEFMENIIENDMMSSRWNTFKFSVQILLSECKDVPACTHCFSNLVMAGTDFDWTI